ncbi:MAG TPA: J domain-containing protein [Thermoanaerobaculia bacterium]|nr:J domain-containing protein [Thermoanaerobaculia bacterium]
MEFVLVVVMIVAGGGLAAVLIAIVGAIDQGGDRASRERLSAMEPREIAAALLVEIARRGGTPDLAARQMAERELGVPAQPGLDPDLHGLARRFAQRAGVEERRDLLETIVRCVVAMTPTIPLRQYDGLLEVSFALGFHSDALARLRARYRFAYVDHARHGRPRDAEGRAARPPLFERRPRAEAESRATLGLGGGALSRASVLSAYRRLAARHHPDRFHDAAGEAQEEASRRFIRLTEAYEDLIPFCGED